MGERSKWLKLGKSGGEDQIKTETIKSIREDRVNVIHKVCEEIWNTGKWPSEKEPPTDCNNYRTIAQISHASKVISSMKGEKCFCYHKFQRNNLGLSLEEEPVDKNTLI